MDNNLNRNVNSSTISDDIMMGGADDHDSEFNQKGSWGFKDEEVDLVESIGYSCESAMKCGTTCNRAYIFLAVRESTCQPKRRFQMIIGDFCETECIGIFYEIILVLFTF